MSPLTAIDVLRIWELGDPKNSIDQALTVLAVACPELTAEQLAELSLGQRDRRLFVLHQRHFGSQLQGFVSCPQCNEHLEFEFEIPAIDVTDLTTATAQLESFCFDGFDLRFRAPNSRDLIAASKCADPQQARQSLVRSCLQKSSRQGLAVAAEEIPEPILVQMENRLAECDPWQEVLLDLECPGCQHRWRPLLDIATFLWKEIAAQAKRLLSEVHTLARAYGWREVDILAMTPRRRRSYLEMVGA